MNNQEINLAVARKLGWTELSLCDNLGQMDLVGKREGSPQFRETVPKYSERIEAAWEIVEWLNKKDYWFTLSNDAEDPERWLFMMDYPNKIDESADTAPLAICKAFLKLDPV